MPEGTTSSPLVEPDVRITRIRLSQKQSAESLHRQLPVSAQRYRKLKLLPVRELAACEK